MNRQEALFLEIWTTWGKPFNKKYFIRDTDFWNQFWDNCEYTEKQIYIALRNIFHACNNGYEDDMNYYESRYISPDPCQFIKGLMLDRGLSEEFDEYYSYDHPDWENSNSEYYDENISTFKD